MPDLSLIVPTYNEAENLPELVNRVRSAMEGYSFELIFVDDDSPDHTAAVAERLKSECPIKLVVRYRERGLSSAVLTGFGHASGPVLGVLDADLQHPPEHLRSMLMEIHRGADLAVASRYGPGGREVGGGVARKIMSRAATLLARAVLSSARMTPDPLSGFFLLRRDVVDGVELKPVGYKILLEVLSRGRARRVKSLPYVFHQRKRGDSKFGWREQAKSLGHMLRLAFAEFRGVRLFRLGRKTGDG
jgi:dolichol-phosphate mannosyltransferase